MTQKDNVYSLTEVVGSSTKSIDDAVATAIKRAHKTLRNLEWFEVTQIRGHIVEGDVEHFQVALKVGFRYDD